MYKKYLLQLEEAGKIRNLKESSINCYKNHVSYFLNYMGKVPEELTCQDVRNFLLTKKDQGLKATTLNLYNSAIRFFYRNVLHILWDDITVPRMIIEHKLPVVLSVDEVDRLLDATDDLKYKAMFATMYSSGMRVSEVIHLHYEDISRNNMQIHVRNTKNRMDRYTILSNRNLALLTEYWFACGRPRNILFPNKFTGEYLTVSSVEQVIRRSASAAGLSGVTPHCLRNHIFYEIQTFRRITLNHAIRRRLKFGFYFIFLIHKNPLMSHLFFSISSKLFSRLHFQVLKEP